MWQRFDATEIASELEMVAQSGLHVIRFFLMTPDFWRAGEPVIAAFKNYRRFWEMLKAAGLAGIPTLFVGHMSGANWEVPGWTQQTFYLDEQVRAEQRHYLETVLEYTPSNAPIYAWCLTNELPMYQQGNAPSEVVAWVREILQLLKRNHPAQVYVGDGGWAPEILGWNHNHQLEAARNFPLRELAPLQDFLALHFYPRTDDAWLHAWEPAYRLSAAKAWHPKVNVGEFGCSTTMVSESNQAAYYGEVLFSALVAQASMVLNWCWSDIDLPAYRPYIDHPFELRFGLRDLHNRMRASLLAMRKVADLSNSLGARKFKQAGLPWGIFIPASFYRQVDFDWDSNVPGKHAFYVNLLGCLKSTGWNPEFVFETAEGDDLVQPADSLTRLRLLLLPRWKRIQAPTQARLLDWVAAGGVLYTSFSLDHWILDLDRILGLETDLKFGIPDYYPRQIMEIRNSHPWGLFDEQFELPTSRVEREDAWLLIKKAEGEVLLQDSQGCPLLIKHRWGKGYFFFSTVPWEVWAWRSQSKKWREFLVRLYASLILDALHPPYLCITPGGEFLPVQLDDNHFNSLYIFNHLWQQTKFELLLFSSRGELSREAVEVSPKDFTEFSFTTLTQEGG